MAGAPEDSRWTDALLDRMRRLGDPLADDPVAAVLDRGGVGEVNAMMRTLVRVDQLVPQDLPDELATYLAQTLPLPKWADQRKIVRGQRVFERWGVYICVCLFSASLPSSYAAAKGVQVLHLTARLDTDARRRVLETGQFLVDVLCVGSLDERGKGRRTIQRVRLMHAAVRHLIKARNGQQPGLWNPEWNEPINQEDLAGTLLAFSGAVIEPLRRLGIRLSAKDIDAYLHLWNVVGHLLGVHDELLVRDADDATALIAAIERRQFKPSSAGQELTSALLELLDEMTPGRQFDDLNPALIRHLIGDEVADMLGVPQSDVVDELGPFARVAQWFFVHVMNRPEYGRARYRLVSRLAPTLGRELVATSLTLQRGGERAPFDIPDRLAGGWGLPPPPPRSSERVRRG
jgi:hypothetical protein